MNRKNMKIKSDGWKRITSALLCCVMLAGVVSAPGFAEQDALGTGLCPHHQEHTEACGYAEGVEGSDCAHVHDETCGYVEGTDGTPCDKECTETDEEGNIVHAEDCAYVPPAETGVCSHIHDESCYLSACPHTHDEACYSGSILPEDTDALVPDLCPHEHTADCFAVNCTHFHEPMCYALLCPHIHDEFCGYVEYVPEIPCNMGCMGVDENGYLIHEEGCAYAPAVEAWPCNHIHGAECYSLAYPNAFEYEDETLGHTYYIYAYNNDCGYTPYVEGSCTHIHDVYCGYVEYVSGVPCDRDCMGVDDNGYRIHEEGCPYTPAVEGQPCNHVHAEGFFTRLCIHNHGAECYSDGVLPIEGEEKPADQCPHVHDAACYATECPHQHVETCYTLLCSHIHSEFCGYIEGEDGSCNHIHDESCFPIQCTHMHTEECFALACPHEHNAEECGYIEPAEGQPCTHEHDEECGYVEAVEGQPCGYFCWACLVSNSVGSVGSMGSYSSGIATIAFDPSRPDTGMGEAGSPTSGIILKNADADTTDSYINDLNLANNSRYAGRVWSDKSVFKNSITLDYGTDGIADTTITSTSDFLHVFSVLGSSQQINGLYQAALDVVFIVDTSASMSSTDPNNGGKQNNVRLQNAGNALNEAMTLLMTTGSPFNRVGLVEFNSVSDTVMTLGRYDATGADGSYFDYSSTTSIGITATPVPNTGASIRSDNTLSPTSPTANVGIYGQYPDHYYGMTNTQAGIYTGMKMLADVDENDTSFWLDAEGNLVNERADATEIKRIPIVILISDGQPTFSLADPNWWDPQVFFGTYGSSRANNGVQGTYFDASYVGNGLLAIATAAYMKQQINLKYYGKTIPEEGDAYAAQVYTFGVELPDNVTREEGYTMEMDHDLADLTLNPGAALTSDTNVMRPQVETAWNTYKSTNGNNRPEIELKNTTRLPNRTGAAAWAFFDNGPHNSPLVSPFFPVYGPSDPSTYTMGHPPADDIVVTGDAAVDLNYVTNYEEVRDPVDLPEIFERLIKGIIAEAPFIPVSGKNDADMDDRLTYIDPIGKYMEVKDVHSILLFGKLCNVDKGELRYYAYDQATGRETDLGTANPGKGNYAYTKQFYTIVGGGENIMDNPCYGYTDSANKNVDTANVTFKVNREVDEYGNVDGIEIYVKHTDSFRDPTLTGSAIQSDPGEDESLYITIPATALPLQVVNIGVTFYLNANGDFIPVYHYNTNLDDKQQSTPLRVFYSVGMDDSVLVGPDNGNRKIDLSKISSSYLKRHREGTTVYFYSNWYREGTVSGHTYGDPVLTFSPDEDNRYYIFQRPLLLYETNSTVPQNGVRVTGSNVDGWSGGGLLLTDRVTTVSGSKDYCIVIDYFDKDSEVIIHRAEPRSGSDFTDGAGNLDPAHLCWYNPTTGEIVDYTDSRPGNGFYLATKAGSLRLGDMAQSIQAKHGYEGNGDARDNDLTRPDRSANTTRTADTYYLPTISSSSGADYSQIVANVYLGNNGRLAITDTELLVTKLVLNDALKDDVFKFEVELAGYTNGTVSAIVVTMDDTEAPDSWRAKVKSVDLLTSNRGMLVSDTGEITVIRENGVDYHVYVGGESGTYTVNVFTASDNNPLTDDALTVTAYLVPVSQYENDMANKSGGWTFQPDASGVIRRENFRVATFDAHRSVGYEIESQYELSITYERRDVTFENGKATIELKHREGLLFTGLPTGTKYTVSEILTPEQVTEGIKFSSVTVEDWHWNSGALENTRTVSHELGDEKLPPTMVFDDDAHTYTATGYTYSNSDSTPATVEDGHAVHLHYDNGVGGKFSIEKTVRNIGPGDARRNDEFTFKITLTMPNGEKPDPETAQYPYEKYLIEGSGGIDPAGERGATGTLNVTWKKGDDGNYTCTATIKLKHGQGVTISELPFGAMFDVEETEHTGYIVSSKNEHGVIKFIEANRPGEGDDQEPGEGGEDLEPGGGGEDLEGPGGTLPGTGAVDPEKGPVAEFENIPLVEMPGTGAQGAGILMPLPLELMGAALVLAVAAAVAFYRKKERRSA